MPRSTARSRNGERTGNGAARETDGSGRGDGERTGNGERVVGRQQGGQRSGEEKRQPLVGSVKEYQGFYEGRIAD